MDDEGLRQDSLNGMPGIQGCGGILEDDLDLPAVGRKIPVGKGGNIHPVEPYFAGSGLVQADQSFAQGAFATATLPDQTKGFPPPDLKAYIIHRFDEFVSRDRKPPETG